jgi:DNA-directed RNA polymerase I, II, and III subunit RPABC5
MVIANKYRYYVEQVRKKKLAKRGNGESIDIDKVLYLTKEFNDKTPAGDVLDELNMKTRCCRRHFLTHVDIE